MVRKRGLSIIEVLVALAACAIVCAAAVPSYMQANSRSNITRAKETLFAADAGLRAYTADYGLAPYDGYNADPGVWAGTPHDIPNYWYLPYMISTPIAYLTSAKVVDPFRKEKPLPPSRHWQYDDVRYTNSEATWGIAYDSWEIGTPGVSSYFDEVSEEFGWRLISVGPDSYYGPAGPTTLFPGASAWPGITIYPSLAQPYDPTNGIYSWGDIMRTERFGGAPYGNTKPF